LLLPLLMLPLQVASLTNFCYLLLLLLFCSCGKDGEKQERCKIVSARASAVRSSLYFP
jgi:hypothetical protein